MNDAAKRARLDGEAMNHRFGFATHWLTITPDDDNSFLVQIFCRDMVDDEKPIEEMTDNELADRAK